MRKFTPVCYSRGVNNFNQCTIRTTVNFVWLTRFKLEAKKLFSLQRPSLARTKILQLIEYMSAKLVFPYLLIRHPAPSGELLII